MPALHSRSTPGVPLLALAVLAVGACDGSAPGPAGTGLPPGMFRGGHDRPGVTDTRGLDRLGGLAWRFRTDGPVRSSPTVVQDVVYFGSTDGRLYAVEAATGSERWRFEIGAPVGGAPLVTESLVVVVDRQNRITAVRPSDGALLWQVEGEPDLPLEWGWEGWDYLLASPMLAAELVLAGTGDGMLYAIEPQSGDVRWRFRTGGRIRSAPAVADGVVYIGSGDGIVYGVSLDDGTEVWRFLTAGHDLASSDFGFDRKQIYSSPTLVDGVLYIGSRDASLYAIDLATRETRWTFEQGTAWIMASPTVADGRVLSARSSGGAVNAVDVGTGEAQWTFTTGGYVYSSPLVVGETVYFGSEDGGIYALNAATGGQRWVYRTGGGVFSTSAVRDGRLFVGSDDGYVYALDGTDGPQPRLAVYWDDAFMDRAVWGRDPSHKRAAEYFAALGYEALDSAGLVTFLDERTADDVPSAVFMAMDAAPGTVMAPDSSALLRRYLDAGGKVVWMGFPPAVLRRDSTGAFIGVDREAPGRLLGVDHQAWDSDEYGVHVTESGREWGLESDWVGMPGAGISDNVTALAIDELGRAAAWVRNYGGSRGTGFVFVRMGTDPAYLEELRSVVEFGVLRPAVRRSM